MYFDDNNFGFVVVRIYLCAAYMRNSKRILHLLQWLCLLLPVILMGRLVLPLSGFAADAGECAYTETATPCRDMGDANGIRPLMDDSSDKLRAIESEGNASEGILSEGMNLIRILFSRQERIPNPLGGFRGRTAFFCSGGSNAALRSYLDDVFNTRHSHFQGEERREVAPYQTSVSCAYYVFALRRILC